MSSLPPTEEVNDLSIELDSLDAIGFVRALRAVDAQIFSGWRQHAGLLDDGPLAAAEQAVQSTVAALRHDGVVVLTGCGTSGRVAHLVARRFNRLLPKEPKAFDYLISGGDAALLLSDELPEDDPVAGAAQLEAIGGGRTACVNMGISCGLSAPYVAGQLDFAISTAASSRASPPRYAAVAIGFNPAALSRDAPVAGLSCGGSFRDICTALTQPSEDPTRPSPHALVNPVVGPEAVAGSSRMKGGSATLVIADAIAYRATRIVAGEDARDAPTIAQCVGRAHEAYRCTYLQARAIASVCKLAAGAMRRGGRLYYVGEGSAGVLGCIDASEMPDTYGVPFDTVRGFVCGGWRDVANREGDLSASAGSSAPLLRLSLADFEADVVPHLTTADAVVLLGSASEPRAPAPTKLGGTTAPTAHDADGSNDADEDNFDGELSDRLWALVLKLRRAGVSGIGLLCSARADDAAGITNAAVAARLDAFAVVPLAAVGLGAGHGSLAELSLKLMLNCTSTFAMTARGLVYQNRMISTSPTNDKIYHRCVRLIAELTGRSSDDATLALLRAVHKLDVLPPALRAAPTHEHIAAATPTGDAQLQQQLVLPLAMLLASSPSTTVQAARDALTREPRVSVLIRQMALAERAGGRSAALTMAPPPTPSACATEAVIYLGLDLGTTSIKAALVRVGTASGGPSATNTSAGTGTDGTEGTSASSPEAASLALTVVGQVQRAPLGADRRFEAVVRELVSLAEQCVAAAGHSWKGIRAVGVSQPGHIDPATGRVEAAANLPWSDVPLCDALASALRKRTVVVEDAYAALLAELTRGGAADSGALSERAKQPSALEGSVARAGVGAGAGYTAALLVLGGGVGSSLSIGGTIHRGARGLVEGGHVIVQPDGRACGCGQKGCLEAYASGTAIASAYREYALQCDGVEHGQLDAIDARSVAAKAEAGDEAARRAMQDAATALGIACVNLCRTGDVRPQLMQRAHAHSPMCSRIAYAAQCRRRVPCSQPEPGSCWSALRRCKGLTACVPPTPPPPSWLIVWVPACPRAAAVDPHTIVLAGGVATESLRTAVQAQMQAHRWAILPDVAEVRLATAGADAGVIGAAAAAAKADASARHPDAFRVRQALPGDRAAAFRVCLLTGDEGADATHIYRTDPDALGKRWVGPYLDLEPELAFVLQDMGTQQVVGYCLAALDSAKFASRLQREYLPALRAAHARPLGEEQKGWSAEECVYSELHDPHAGEPPAAIDLAAHPSHLHIDLMACAQGYGLGRRMMEAMLSALRKQGSKGAFLQMHEGNARARLFYESLGFEELSAPAEGGGGGGTGGELYLGVKL